MFRPPQQRFRYLRYAERAKEALLTPMCAPLSDDPERPAQALIQRKHARRHLQEERGKALPDAVAPHLHHQPPEEQRPAPEGGG